MTTITPKATNTSSASSTNSSVTYGGITVEQSIQLPQAKVDTDVPYEFKGKNNNSYGVLIRPLPTCGCTTAVSEFAVGPGEEFSVTGHYKRTMKEGVYSKVVHLYFGRPSEGTNSEERKITVNFNGRIVE